MKRLILLSTLFFASTTAFAAEEDWYVYWALGLVEHDYPRSLDSTLNRLESQPGVDRTELGIDALGFYLPQSNNRLLGLVVSGSADAFSTPNGDLQINQYLYGVSGMQFFGDEIGDGFYIRGDVGIAKVSFTLTNTGFGNDSISETGYGYLIGIGYGIPISDETRILLSVNFSDKQVDGESWRSTTFNIGGLW